MVNNSENIANVQTTTSVPLSDLTELALSDARASAIFPGLSTSDAGLAFAGLVLAVLFVGGIGFSFYAHPHKTMPPGDETDGIVMARSSMHNSLSGTTLPVGAEQSTSPTLFVSQRATPSMAGFYDAANMPNGRNYFEMSGNYSRPGTAVSAAYD